jgi:hypothetical protein
MRVAVVDPPPGYTKVVGVWNSMRREPRTDPHPNQTDQIDNAWYEVYRKCR